MKYPKLNTVWKRDERKGKKGVILRGEPSDLIFTNIKKWSVSEKIDGTNVRIMCRGDRVIIGGREIDETQSNFELPKPLLKYLREKFTISLFEEFFGSANVTLFGEGYSAKIESGGNYRADQSFVLFDVVVHDIEQDWWLERHNVEDVANKLGIEMVPEWSHLAEFEEIENWVMSKQLSRLAEKDMVEEGLVFRAYPMVMFRNGTPVMFKLKVRDYIAYEKKIDEKLKKIDKIIEKHNS